MATNYTLKMAAEAIKNNDKEAIMDCGKRFPLTTTMIAKLVTSAGDDFVDFASSIPEHVTVRKIESVLKDGVSEPVDDEVETPVAEEPKLLEDKPKKEKKAKTKKEEKVEDDPIPAPVESNDSEYASMTAVELFKLCKKKGIKAEPKQKAEVYISLLEEADKPQENADSDEDDWDI